MESYTVLVAPELIEILLHTVHAYSSNALASCLRVCRQWRAIGEPILWKHVYLELKDIEAFIAAVPRAGLRRIQSMTLDFHKSIVAEDYETSLMTVAPNLLSLYLLVMPNLVSLSCRFAPDAPGKDNFRAAASLLRKLPPTVRNLELLNCQSAEIP